MSKQSARHFISALGRLESKGDVDPIVATFAERRELGNVLPPERR